VINGTLTGTASCSGSQTGAQDDVKTDENAALFARLHMLFESSERFLTEQLDYNLPWVRGRGDHDRRYCGLGWQRVRRRQAEAESQSKCVNMGWSAYTLPRVRLGQQSGALFRPELVREWSVSIVVFHKLLVLSVSS
jgi:hypothetical protein